jgi:hypothetical protein
MKRTFIFIISIALSANLLTAQEYYSKQKLIADIDSLYASIKEIHVDMFANISKQEFEKNLNQIKTQLKDSMTRIEFHKNIAPLVEKLGDGHTSLQYPKDDLKDPSIRLFPIVVDINFKDSSVIVADDYSQGENKIPTTAKIISINRKSATTIIGEMFHYVSGEKTFFKAEILSSQFTPLLYSLCGDTTFTIQYQYKNKILCKTVPAIFYSQRYESKIKKTTNHIDNYSLHIDDKKKIAIIEFNSFSNLSHFRKFIDSAFVIIKQKKLNDLIIDIRKNGGGNSDLGDELFQYISPVAFKQFGKRIVNNSYRRMQFYKSAYSDTITDPIGLQTRNDTTLIKLRENRNRFTGNVYLLTSHFTFSSAASFSWAFKYFKMGTTIGEETGGMAVCFGDIIWQTLPNTKIKYFVSHKKFYQYGATDNDIHGTIPDYIVSEKNALDFTRELIKKRKK